MIYENSQLIYMSEKLTRALHIAAIGRHSVLLVGPHGSGKTLFPRVYASLLEPMGAFEAEETDAIYACVRMKRTDDFPRAFRTPHHTCSANALVGSNNRPGEVSLAHQGVLFLNELTEFRGSTLDHPRSVLIHKKSFQRSNSSTIIFPADFTLIAAMSPCPCDLPKTRCQCSKESIQRHLQRVPLWLLESFDLCIPTFHLADSSFVEFGVIKEKILRTRPKIHLQKTEATDRVLSVMQSIDALDEGLSTFVEQKDEAYSFQASKIFGEQARA